MNTLAKSLIAIFLMFGAFSAFAATGVDLYWPLHDGDQATFVYGKNKTLTLTVSDLGAGTFAINEDSPDVSATLYVDTTPGGIQLSEITMGWTDVYFDPEPVLLNDAVVQNGGRVKTTTTVTQSGIDPYPASFTLKVRKAKRVRVPAGRFTDCRSIVSSEKAKIPGYGNVHAQALTAYLAPNVGIAKILVKPGHWATLVSATIGGTTIGTAGKTPSILATRDDVELGSNEPPPQ